MQTDGTLLVPDVPTVPYITGDGVGAEVTPAMQAVVDAAIRKAYGGKRRIEWKEVLAGERATILLFHPCQRRHIANTIFLFQTV